MIYYYNPRPLEGKTAGMVAYFIELGGRFNSLNNRISFALSMGVGQRFFIGAPNKSSSSGNGVGPFGGTFKRLSVNPQLQLSYNLGKK